MQEDSGSIAITGELPRLGCRAMMDSVVRVTVVQYEALAAVEVVEVVELS